MTEEVTGLDLVQWQLRIARGERLDAAPTPHGHAVEVRLYAEDPRTFLPQIGRITRLQLPTSIRVDAGVAEGDEIGTSYDPLLAKLIASGGTRDEALDRLRDALAETDVQGVTTNLPFLRWLVDHPELRAGAATTAFLVEHPPLSTPPPSPPAVWRGPLRLNLPSPPPAAAPDEGAAAHLQGPAGARSNLITAPMPGTVLKVHVREGSTVRAGEALLVLEAMKMENSLTAPHDARVLKVHVREADRVAGGTVLIELES